MRQRSRVASSASVIGPVIGLVAVLALAGCMPAATTSAAPGAPSSAPSPNLRLVERGSPEAVPLAPARDVFGPASEWRRDVRDAPAAADSAALVRNLAAQVHDHYNGVAAFDYDRFDISTYTVSADVARHRVVWDNCQDKPRTPPQLYHRSDGGQFLRVPIPDDAIPAVGTDGRLAVYAPLTDQLWEFYRAHREADRWHACWGGRIDHVSRSPGFFANPMGPSASGLSAQGASISIREVLRHRIDHAMGLGIVDVANRRTYSYPAQRSDGTQPAGTADAIPEGQRFRLPASVDVASLHLSPIARDVAVAAQRYGFIVTDRSGAVALSAESGAGAAKITGSNPWDYLLGGTPGDQVLAGFPWGELTAIRADWGKPAGR